MQRVFMLGVLVFGVLFLGGCAPSFNIRPDYNENKKEVLVDDYIIKDISFYDKKKSNIDMNSLGSTGYFIKRFKSNSGVCSNLESIEYDADGNWYYYFSMLDQLQKKYNNNCEVETIGNGLHFLKCYDKYYITSSMYKHSGYGRKTGLIMSKDCFNDMKKHFKSKVNPKYVETKNISFALKKYMGTFIATNESECANRGEIEIEVKNGTIEGNIFYKLKGLTHRSKVSGNVVGNNFAGETENLKFIGTITNNLIVGNYYNTVCKGKFEANLQK